jgi:hypothetical protein
VLHLLFAVVMSGRNGDGWFTPRMGYPVQNPMSVTVGVHPNHAYQPQYAMQQPQQMSQMVATYPMVEKPTEATQLVKANPTQDAYYHHFDVSVSDAQRNYIYHLLFPGLIAFTITLVTLVILQGFHLVHLDVGMWLNLAIAHNVISAITYGMFCGIAKYNPFGEGELNKLMYDQRQGRNFKRFFVFLFNTCVSIALTVTILTLVIQLPESRYVEADPYPTNGSSYQQPLVTHMLTVFSALNYVLASPIAIAILAEVYWRLTL